MSINLFFQLSKEFFDEIHSPYIDTDDFIDEENELLNLQIFKGVNSDTEELCECNLCYVVRRIILFINPSLLKYKLN